jgi:glycosyltransferase involved in cell wall biosynthesis
MSVQIEMEKVCTKHLKKIGAWLPPVFDDINLASGTFPVEASVIIPVRNRERTISDAIDSVLSQQTTFPFNVIIIDNHSTDGTTEIITEKALKDSRIIHLKPERDDLGIGGCWNEGVQHPSCGRFAIQLDSDDVYSSDQTLANIVREFYTQNCAMLVGSYRMCNFNLDTIPPGIIDHKEWTQENGRNNVLRINGLGAPRAFFTPLLRSIKVPNTSYGEDYALGLQFSRHWKIGRIYDVLYLCRRWEDNSDASIDLIRSNTYNAYKDKLRSIELAVRHNIRNQKNKFINSNTLDYE